MTQTLDRPMTDTTLAVTRERTPESVFGLVNAIAPETQARGDRLRVESTRFGTLEVEEESILTFQEGLIGFEACHRYAVVCREEGSDFRWLQSLDAPAVAFPVVEPNQIRPDYAPRVSDTDSRALELTEDTPTLLFTIVNVPTGDSQSITVNLRGPLVVNARTRRGRQVILQEDRFTACHSIVEELVRAATLTENRS